MVVGMNFWPCTSSNKVFRITNMPQPQRSFEESQAGSAEKYCTSIEMNSIECDTLLEYIAWE